MGHVYYFPSDAVVSTEKFLPICLALARQGHTVHTVFLGGQSYRYLSTVEPYAHWIRTFTRPRKLIISFTPTFVDKVRFVVQYAWLWIEMRMGRRYLAFFGDRTSSRFLLPLSKIAQQRGRSIALTEWYVDVYHDLDWGRLLDNEDNRRRIGKPPKRRIAEPEPPLAHDALLLYNAEVQAMYEPLGSARALVVPHPKLQEWWHAFVRAQNDVYARVLPDADERVVVVFLTHRGNYFFQEGSDLDVLIPEIVGAVRRVLPTTRIILKPKQTVDINWLRACVDSLDDRRIAISTLPVSLLAERALVGISTAQTTAQFEFTASEAPWIEYCRYSDFWAEMYPPLTYTERYGGRFARTPHELEELIRNRSALRSGSAAIAEAVHFQECSISFDYFWRSSV